tara:strand:- start:4766 stop:5635 length:870 start_codon:yes stop_codon:yes gene_type:complete
MKYIKLFEQYLFEYEIFDYKIRSHTDNEWRYEFTVDVDPEIAAAINSPYPDKLLYTCSVWHDRNKHSFGMYEAEFGVKGQEHPGAEVGLDIKHFNSVLYTCGEIIDDVVEQQLIATLRVQGAGGEKDNISHQLMNIPGLMFQAIPNVRAKIYKRWAERRYGKSNVKSAGSFMDIDMKSARPKLFKGHDKTKDLIDVIDKYMNTDNVYDRKELERGLSGYGIANFDFSSDAVMHKEYGTLYVEVTVHDKAKDYSMSVDFYDNIPDEYPDGITEYFKSFNQLINYIKNLKF